MQIGPPRKYAEARPRCHFCGEPLRDLYVRESLNGRPRACRPCRPRLYAWIREHEPGHVGRQNELRRRRRAEARAHRMATGWRPYQNGTKPKGTEDVARAYARCPGCGRIFLTRTLADGLCCGPWCAATTPEMLDSLL